MTEKRIPRPRDHLALGKEKLGKIAKAKVSTEPKAKWNCVGR